MWSPKLRKGGLKFYEKAKQFLKGENAINRSDATKTSKNSADPSKENKTSTEEEVVRWFCDNQNKMIVGCSPFLSFCFSLLLVEL